MRSGGGEEQRMGSAGEKEESRVGTEVEEMMGGGREAV